PEPEPAGLPLGGGLALHVPPGRPRWPAGDGARRPRMAAGAKAARALFPGPRQGGGAAGRGGPSARGVLLGGHGRGQFPGEHPSAPGGSASMTSGEREFLGSRRGFGEIDRLYLRPDSLEILTLDWLEIRGRRLPLDELTSVTLHREVRAAWTAISIAFHFLFLLLYLAGRLSAVGPNSVGLVLCGLGAILSMFLYLPPQRIVVIRGARGTVRLVHTLRPHRALHAFLAISDAAEAAQRRNVARNPAISPEIPSS